MRDESDITFALARVMARRMTVEQYADTRYTVKDRHGIQDAQSDLRELDAVVATLEYVLGMRENIGR